MVALDIWKEGPQLTHGEWNVIERRNPSKSH
jgi:hypothetical protein